MSGYTSIFIRDALTDTGQVPSGVRTASASPDIVPSGILPIQDFQTYLKAKWDKDVGKDTVLNKNNYYYVRGKNIGTSSQSGSFRLYGATSGTLIQPGQWKEIPSYQNSSIYKVGVGPTSADGIAVPDQAFYWQNVQAPPTNQHYCLLATFQNQTVPDPMPTSDFETVDAFIRWVTYNPNVAWRNILVVDSNVKSKTISINISNPDPNPRDFTFVADCSDLPEMTKVTLSCASSKPSPEIYYNGYAGSTKTFSLTTKKTTLPAQFPDTPLVLTLEAPEGKTLTGATVALSQDLVQDEATHASIRSLARPLAAQLAHSIGEKQIELIRCGQFTTVFAGSQAGEHPIPANLHQLSEVHYG